MILILTQSGRTGKNRLIAEDCATIINHFSSIEPDIKNFDEVSNDALKGYDKIVMIVPEWNRSIPFTLKQMIDNAEWPSLLKNKDIYLIGTSGGIGGNMLGISHLTDILHYCGSNVCHNKVYVSGLETFDRDSELAKVSTEMISNLMKELCSTYTNDQVI